jgi:hypothetical protein
MIRRLLDAYVEAHADGQSRRKIRSKSKAA